MGGGGGVAAGVAGGVEEKCKKYFLHLLLRELSQFSQLQCHKAFIGGFCVMCTGAAQIEKARAVNLIGEGC